MHFNWTHSAECFDYSFFLYNSCVSLSHSITAHRKERIYLNNADPITSLWKTSDRKLSKKLYIIFVYHHYKQENLYFFFHTRQTQLFWTLKIFFFCSTINNMRIWKERNVVSWEARRKKRQARIVYSMYIRIIFLLCMYIE